MRLLREEETVIAGIPACVRYKNIKNLYLRVRPPDGHIELSVPCHTAYADMEEYRIMHRPLLRGRSYAERTDGAIVLHAAEGADAKQRRAALDALYRTELAAAIEREAPACEEIVGKHASRWRIRGMKTRWGSCNIRTAAITLNLQLAQYDVRALRCVIIHELTHLWVRGHDARFYARMDMYFPDWQEMRRMLNSWARADGI